MMMVRTSFRLAAAAFLAASLTAADLPAAWSAGQDGTFAVAQDDCYSVGQQVAAQQGGTLARANQADQGGQPVCVIVVLVPAKDGQRPRRVEFVVPRN